MRMRKAAAAAGGSRRSASSPFSRLLFYLTTTLLSLHPPLLASAATAPSDAAAMSAIASAIKPLPTNWASDPSADPCSLTSKWKGVSCSDSGRVTFLNLQKSSISGTLPPEIANLTALQSLSLQNNNLGGPLPSFSGLSALQEIYLSRNQFTSIPPTFFSGLTSLMNVSLDYNPFSNWNIPDDLSQAVNLVAFNAMNASVTGPIPPFFGKLASLQTLRLSYNSIVGGIPPEFRGSGVRELYLNNQDGTKLSGTVEVLASMSQLTDVWLQVNNFTGPIPDLSNCTDLAVLYLRDNKFTGMVPASLSTLPSLSDIQIAHNDLQGPYPDIKATVWKEGPDSGNNFCNSKPGPCDPTVMTLLAVAEAFGYPTVIAESWKGNDACANWIFITCDSQKRITVLNFGNQKFGGTISPAIANITSLKSLILSNNNLQGSIPDALTTLPQLQLIDVSNNNLSGKVPTFRSNLEFKSSGNPLLGKELPAGGGSSQSTSGGTSPADGTSEAKSGSKSSGLMIALIIVAVVLLVAGSLSSFVYYKRRQHLKFRKVQVQSPPSEPEPFKINVNHYLATAMSPSELQSQGSSDSRNGHAVDAVATFMSMQALRLATDNFSDSNVLGRGGFGVVYKGELGDGTLIAVKRMECGEMGKKGMTEFQAELAVLTKVRHRHLVALLGFCVEGIERLLVYEYMPQGTLSQHLFGGDEMGYVSLTWKQRLIIALDVARGLEYLHSLAHKSFIHRDLKPSNILLGNDMRAKVSDFGLVKLAPDGKYSVETRLAGTFGYLAPEYATTGRVTTKVDVYAFGVVLMELITGRKALDDSLSEENTHLVTWFRRVLINKGGSISKAADPSLDMTDEDDLRSLNAVAELAGHCTAREAHQRPDMGHAVNVLAPLVDQWKPSTSGAGGGNEENFDASFNGSLTQRLKRWQMNEGSSISGFGFDDSVSIRMENTQGSIPSKPEMYPHGR